ncbi:MAG: hypothetical protein ACK55Z_29605 [bacterium]
MMGLCVYRTCTAFVNGSIALVKMSAGDSSVRRNDGVSASPPSLTCSGPI